MKKILILFMSLLMVSTGCKKVPITGRRQMGLLPNSTLNSMALTSYRDFLSKNKVTASGPNADMVKRVGQRIQKATETYFKATGKSKLLSGYKWEYNLVEDPQVNAWCMPGGKVVVYSGLIPVAKNEDGLAVVMGHEIAHAIANHGNERMSQGLMVQLGGTALSVALSQKPQETQDLFLNAYGAGAQLGALLPFSRLHESEADEIGLILAAIAGYNVKESIPFWERMEAASKGVAPPQLLSTHPSGKTRIADLQKVIPRAEAFGRKYGGKK